MIGRLPERPAGRPNYRAIRDDRWKLILKRSGGELSAAELYDLGQDPAEKFDRVEHHPDIAQRLLAEASEFYQEFIKDRRPVGRIE